MNTENYTQYVSGFNMFGWQEVPLDNMPAPLPPASVCSSNRSPPTTPLTPEPSPFSSPSQFPLFMPGENNVSVSAALLPCTLLLQRQYHYQLMVQQQQQQLALAQQQLALAASAAATSNQQGKDEIAHSLKMFALLSACKSENNGNSTSDVMQEFALNGYASEDLNRLQCQNTNTVFSGAATSFQPHTQPSTPLAIDSALWLNQYHEQLSNMWRTCNMPAAFANNASCSGQAATGTGPALVAAKYVNNCISAGAHSPVEPNKQNKRHNNKIKDSTRHCVFCGNNNEPEAVVQSHTVRDSLGRVLCPKLRTYVCPICKASGDYAHTIKYCPKKPIVTMEDAIKAESYRLTKSAFYKQQMKV